MKRIKAMQRFTLPTAALSASGSKGVSHPRRLRGTPALKINTLREWAGARNRVGQAGRRGRHAYEGDAVN
jgi:hypothetical protein